MNTELIKQAIRSRIGKRELYVLLANELGISDPYDIQQLTGMRPGVIAKSAQNVQELLRSYSYNISLLRSSIAQNVQNPPSQIFAYLSSSLNRSSLPGPADKAACKRIYLKARSLKSSSVEAVQLVKDCIDTNDLSRANYPAIYLQRVFDTYLASLPREMPLNIWEQQQRDGFHRRWNNVTRQWERTEVRLDQS